MTGSGRGGRRPGAGRPKGTTKDVSCQRKQRQVRAFDDEWEAIKEFMKVVRVRGVERGRAIIEQFKAES